MKTKSPLLKTLLITLTITSISSQSLTVHGEDNTPTIEDKLQELRQKHTQFKENKDKLGEIDHKEQEIQAQLKQLDDDVAFNNDKIRTLQSSINNTKHKIDKLEHDIAALHERITKREKVIKERLRVMQAHGGGLSYMDLFLGIKKFSDFIDATNTVAAIIQADQEMLKVHYEDQKLKKQMEGELHNSLPVLAEQLKSLESVTAILHAKVAEKNSLMQSLKQEKIEIEAELVDLSEAHEILIEQAIAIIQENKRAQKEISPGGSGIDFIKPTNGGVTSGYGPRGDGHHAGIDISDQNPDTAVAAAASGTVIRSYYSNSYGNCVMIAHKIKDKIFTTVYAHLENRFVKNGETVTQGQQIGYMGNTGHSFGKHLHFELHEGPWNIDKTNSVDPVRYIRF
ncbi:murein hydrolase activator EnvC family protein [Bacillus sp. T33-2]|uniref:murein hydrolase activator EnvC family protein n=1 Tax=Bacillus sp. T33-2 TaxID=2054168 RepID=UPI000C7722BE|nr:peptidoglycan DD-metalloendopeptidase family protein [Bacillus sp. T33-2]PLR99255.1 peptidase M23 [Bacillus sp. T33-2]